MQKLIHCKTASTLKACGYFYANFKGGFNGMISISVRAPPMLRQTEKRLFKSKKSRKEKVRGISTMYNISRFLHGCLLRFRPECTELL